MHLKTDTSANSHFASVPSITHSRNGFAVAEKHVTTCQFDYLYPISWKYIYPGDTLSVQQMVMARLQTQIAPLYDDLYFDLHAWFVPMRLIQTNWARYQFNAQPTGPTQDNSALTSPKITLSGLGAGGFVAKTLYDYLGFPTEVDFSGDTEHMNNYLARSYSTIWNQNYRDENLQNAVVVDLDDGPDNPTDYVLLKRGKRHDRFTSCLTAAQKGAAVLLPLGTSAPVWGSTVLPTGPGAINSAPWLGAWATTPATDGSIATRFGVHALVGSAAVIPSATDPIGLGYDAGGTARDGSATERDGATNAGFLDKASSIALNASSTAPWSADLTAASSATINQVRQSYAVQHLLEADARGGTRDVESIQHRWGVTVPDFRLQRPEYLGGQTFTFDGHLVPQTSSTSGSNYQAGLAMFSQAMSAFKVTHSFVEHGVFMILLSARSNITYQEGLLRELSYKTRYDWYQPEFANLGEVAVLNKEIYAIGSTGVQDNQTFGFQEYAYELRYGLNRVSAEMRSNYATSLDSRHMADDYASLPSLGSAWIPSNTTISRNIAVAAATADPIQLNMMLQGTIARTLPMYSIPGLKRL